MKYTIGVFVLTLVGLMGWWVWYMTQPGKYDTFAECLSEKQALFYGAFWCPHCQEQKALFGKKSAALLPYVECSTPDGKAQLQVCIDKNIKGYPTWIFADGGREERVLTLQELSQKTLCPLPQS